MNVSPEEQELLKQDCFKILDSLKTEIEKRISDGELSSKSISVTKLLDDFSKIMSLLKQVSPKINLMVPINFNPDRQKKVDNLYNEQIQLR